MNKVGRSGEVRSNTRTVAKNFLWAGLEVSFAIFATLLTTVAVARIIGPQKLGYFNFVYWLTSTTGLVGSLGIPMTTLKYMAEFLGANQRSQAKSVFWYSMRIQAGIAVLLALIGEIVVFTVGDPEYRTISAFLVLSLVPQMITFIPSQANAAAENIKANTRGALFGMVVNVVGVGLSLALGWNLLGIAIFTFLYRACELVAKFLPVHAGMSGVGTEALSAEIKKRMFAFSGRSTGLMLLQVLVWDRSDVIFLKLLQSDIKQIAFFSISFSLAERLLMLPQAFASALGATQMAEYGRDRERLYRMTSVAATYIILASLPILLLASTLSGPIVKLLYGSQYLPAISVFAIVAMFAIPKGVLGPAQTLLYSTEDLGFLLGWGCFCGAVNIIGDLVLIPRMGAVGAALANGSAQTLAAIGIWYRAISRYHVRLDSKKLAKIAIASAFMCTSVLLLNRVKLPFVVTLISGSLVGGMVFLVGLRWLRVFEQKDRERLLLVGKRLPRALNLGFTKFLSLLMPNEPGSPDSAQTEVTRVGL